ncbi:MAG: ferrous iron transport protein B [Pseudomonadota bacterium]
MADKTYTIALAGNPNSGKTTIFNVLTGTRQKVGNWPGVTVEKKEGLIHRNGTALNIVDLPGTYSLTPFSIEEVVARDFLLEARPDVVVSIIDASNLERSLYLATQMREIDCRVIFALNMADVARSRGMRIDTEKLSDLLNVPVVLTVANRKEGLDDLMVQVVAMATDIPSMPCRRRVKYSADIETAISELQGIILSQIPERDLSYNLRWTAIKLLEDDKILKERILQRFDTRGERILDAVRRLRERLHSRYDDDPEIIMTDERYGFIAGIIREVLTISPGNRVDISRNVDMVLTHRYLGYPIFFLFIWGMFQLTFRLGDYPMGWLEGLVAGVNAMAGSLLPASLFKDLILNGIIAGVGSVIIFLPNILILFFCIALFEDTGYMARAAFLMDKVMHAIGLHGKSFIPMLMGFGCNVPAIMAARTLESEKDRVLTILITPFMSCSAKLPVYIILAGAFFGPRGGSVIFVVYLVGISLAVVSGRLFSATLLKGVEAPFVMELPPYRIPMIQSLLIHMWDRSKLFLKKMGGIILIGSIVIWALSTFPRDLGEMDRFDRAVSEIRTEASQQITRAPYQRQAVEDAATRQISGLQSIYDARRVEHSFLGRLGQWLAPVFAPLGIDWRGGVALITGFVAKEVVVSTLGVLHAIDHDAGSDALRQALQKSGMTPLSAFSMMIFVLLYVPCLATVAAIRRETGSLGWTAFSVVYSTGIAWATAFCAYQIGILLGIR